MSSSSSSPPQIDLFRTFFRTRPSILTTVLPTSIHYALEQLKTSKSENENSGKNSEKNDDHQENASANPVNTKSVAEINSEFQKFGIEFVPESNRFRFLSSHVAENAKDRAPLDSNTFKRASKIIKENAQAERDRREKLSKRNQRRAMKEVEKMKKKMSKKAAKKKVQ